MSGLMVLLLIIMGLFLVPLVLPVSFQGQVRIKESLSGHGEVSGFGGLIKLRVDKEAGNETRQYLKILAWEKILSGGKPAKTASERKQDRSRFKDVITRELLNAVYRYLKRLVKCLRLEAGLEGEYGTGDPALTGFLAGVIAALASQQLRICLNPNFMEASLDMEGEVQGRFFPIVVLWHTVVLLLSAPVRSLWWPKFTNKKRVREVVGSV
ncbi:MAG: DUF2953 domain-containing protein [Syntrophomonadaceae bacterium]|nr:DUF2953 domain-containing protein [Syntrophomonadaceae bacterium]